MSVALYVAVCVMPVWMLFCGSRDSVERKPRACVAVCVAVCVVPVCVAVRVVPVWVLMYGRVTQRKGSQVCVLHCAL